MAHGVRQSLEQCVHCERFSVCRWHSDLPGRWHNLWRLCDGATVEIDRLGGWLHHLFPDRPQQAALLHLPRHWLGGLRHRLLGEGVCLNAKWHVLHGTMAAAPVSRRHLATLVAWNHGGCLGSEVARNPAAAPELMSAHDGIAAIARPA
jgi:hypothetical protein